jgi:hypothetical protein
MATGFEAGLSNWSSIHSNILRANQGAKSLEQDERRINLQEKKDKRAWKIDKGKAKREQQKWKIDKETLGRENQARLRGVELNNRLTAIKSIFEVPKSALGVVKQVSDIYTGLRGSARSDAELRLEQEKYGDEQTEAKRVIDEKVKAKKRLGKIGDRVLNLSKEYDDASDDRKVEISNELEALKMKSMQHHDILGPNSFTSPRTSSGGGAGSALFGGIEKRIKMHNESEAHLAMTGAKSRKDLNNKLLRVYLGGDDDYKEKYESFENTVAKSKQWLDDNPGAPHLLRKPHQVLIEQGRAEMAEMKAKAVIVQRAIRAELDPRMVIARMGDLAYENTGIPYTDAEGNNQLNANGHILYRRTLNTNLAINRGVSVINDLKSIRDAAKATTTAAIKPQVTVSHAKTETEGGVSTGGTTIEAVAGDGTETPKTVTMDSTTSVMPSSQESSMSPGWPEKIRQSVEKVNVKDFLKYLDEDERGESMTREEYDNLQKENEKQRLFDENMPLGDVTGGDDLLNLTHPEGSATPATPAPLTEPPTTMAPAITSPTVRHDPGTTPPQRPKKERMMKAEAEAGLLVMPFVKSLTHNIRGSNAPEHRYFKTKDKSGKTVEVYPDNAEMMKQLAKVLFDGLTPVEPRFLPKKIKISGNIRMKNKNTGRYSASRERISVDIPIDFESLPYGKDANNTLKALRSKVMGWINAERTGVRDIPKDELPR